MQTTATTRGRRSRRRTIGVRTFLFGAPVAAAIVGYAYMIELAAR